jgi:dTDP-4-amino-4,6-dideoxygalactose transaminase
MTVPFLDLQAMHRELEEEIDETWSKVSSSAGFIGGEFVERFETQWAEYCGVPHCVGVASGTAALELCLTALQIGPGSEVIVPANTFVATAEAIVRAGARPVFIDVDPSTLLMTATGVEAAITSRTEAVIVVHLYGQPADMDGINRVAAAAGIAVIEDAAQAHGAKWNGKRAGSLSLAGCFSFYPSKNLGAFGDAGAVVSRDPTLIDRIRCMGNHGRPKGQPHLHEMIGSTNRLDALQAAILLTKLEKLDTWNAERRRAASQYEKVLAGLPVEIVSIAARACSSHHLMVIQTPRRDELRQELDADGVTTGIHYPIPCHRQQAFRTNGTPSLPVAECAAARILSLPMFPHLTNAQIARVGDAIERTCSRWETCLGLP